MKKLLFVALFAFSVFTASAQVNLANLLSTHGLVLDTVDNTAAQFMQAAVAGSRATVTVVATVTEISGTTAGAVKLWGSIDGGTTYALVDGAGTFSPADVTTAQSYAWIVAPSGFTNYRIVYTGAGTMSAKIGGKILYRTK